MNKPTTTYTDYPNILESVKKCFANRLSMHKTSREIFLDRKPFNLTELKHEIYSKFQIVLENDKHVKSAVYLCAKENVFSPIEEYLDECKALYPEVDSNKVFKTLCEDVLHISNPLEAKYLAITLVGAVNRVKNPGCQHDTVLILRGGQGLRKTSFFRELAGLDWFTSLTLRNYSKDELQACHSKWFIELEECEGSITSRNLSLLKGFITKCADTFRKPYAENVDTYPRQFLLVGTTNQSKFLQDDTGNRRFLVIDITEKIDVAWVKENRNLIWAAALKAYEDGHPTYLNETEQDLSNAINAMKYEQEDLWFDLIANWTSEQTQMFTLSDVLIKALGKEPKSWKRSDETRVKKILKALGFQDPKQVKVNGKNGRHYDPSSKSLITN